MSSIIKDNAQAIIDSNNAKYFSIIMLDGNGSVYFWKGNGFDLADDANGFISLKAVPRDIALAEFNKAYNVATSNAKKGIMFANGGTLKISGILSF